MSRAHASPADVVRTIKSKSSPRYETVAVTPELAQQWLGHNTINRPVRRRIVNTYAKDMAADNWRETGEAIKFADDGRLIDGQHRLLAVIQADVTVVLLVAYGLDPQTQDVLDTGAKRSAGDVLSIHGRDNASLLAATAKWCVIWDAELLYTDRASRAVTHSDITEYVTDNDELTDAVNLAASVRRHIDLQPSIAATTLYLTSRQNRPAAAEFFTRLADGIGLEAGSPILALRSRLREIKNNRQRVEPEALISLVIRAWNAWREGRSLASIPVYRGKAAIRCPQPKV